MHCSLFGVFTRGLPVCFLCPTPTSRNRSKTLENADLGVNFFMLREFHKQNGSGKTRLKKRAKVTEKFEFFRTFFSDYQMVECFRYFDTIFSEFRNFFDREITDLFVSRINRHPVEVGVSFRVK